jgi:hypothetical protein
MPPLDRDDIKQIVNEVLEQVGLDQQNRAELRADFLYLRKWRKSVEQIHGFTLRALITVVVTGFLGMMWMGVKTLIGK